MQILSKNIVCACVNFTTRRISVLGASWIYCCHFMGFLSTTTRGHYSYKWEFFYLFFIDIKERLHSISFLVDLVFQIYIKGQSSAEVGSTGLKQYDQNRRWSLLETNELLTFWVVIISTYCVCHMLGLSNWGH